MPVLMAQQTRHDGPCRPGLVTVRVCEELDIASQARVSERLQEALELRPERPVIDLQDCAFLDATGASALVDARRRAQHLGTDLVLTGMSPRLTNLLRCAASTASSPSSARSSRACPPLADAAPAEVPTEGVE